MQALLRAGARVDDRGPAGDATPLLMAIAGGQSQAARLLLDAGADAQACSRAGVSALRSAVVQDDRDVVTALLRHGAEGSIDVWGAPGGRTALGLAAERLNAGMVGLPGHRTSGSTTASSDVTAALLGWSESPLGGRCPGRTDRLAFPLTRVSHAKERP